MRCSLSSAAYPLIYFSSGMLFSPNHFVHPDRLIDTYVLILVRDGELFITVDNLQYCIQPNHFVVLFPGLRHFGTKPSEGNLAYYWMHFKVQDPNVVIKCLSKEQYLADIGVGTDKSISPEDEYIIPEYGSIGNNKKPEVLFQDLIEIARRGNYRASFQCHYLSSNLLLEITHEFDVLQTGKPCIISSTVSSVLTYIHRHYSDRITVSTISSIFGYHPVYLERLFKKETGCSIIKYINQTRLEASKNLLVNSSLSLESIAISCGFNDVRYYIRVFHKYYGITPTQYKTEFLGASAH